MALKPEEVLVLRVNLALKLKGLSLNALAKAMGKNQANVYRTMRNPKHSSEIWKEITRRVGFDPRTSASKELKELCREVAFEQAA